MAAHVLLAVVITVAILAVTSVLVVVVQRVVMDVQDVPNIVPQPVKAVVVVLVLQVAVGHARKDVLAVANTAQQLALHHVVQFALLLVVWRATRLAMVLVAVLVLLHAQAVVITDVTVAATLSTVMVCQLLNFLI